jgi:hypothetical protein
MLRKDLLHSPAHLSVKTIICHMYHMDKAKKLNSVVFTREKAEI